MAQQKPSIPKGTRDFSAQKIYRRNYIFDIIASVYRAFGFAPIETPAMEYLSTLLGKYGNEGDTLLFKILNSGDFLNTIPKEELSEISSQQLIPKISEKGLRYDLTVPFARYVVQHRNEITFPFKRYQIQPVWRADRPQKGRFREFYQCDADIIGSDSLVNEVELIQIIDEVFRKLEIEVTILINNRKILTGISEIIGFADRVTEITTVIDKLDKIGLEAVCDELKKKGLSDESVKIIRSVLTPEDSDSDNFTNLKQILQNSEIGIQGITEIEKLQSYLSYLNINANISFIPSLARGLDYYTGTIFEVKSAQVDIGSICGGGRYDNLTGVFGLSGISGVGISFGADRIYEVISQLQKFPKEIAATTKILLTNFGSEAEKHCLSLLQSIRQAGISAELYPDPVKLKKQMNYANKKQIPYVGLIGENEIQNQTITLKDMTTGEQQEITLQELITIIKKKNI